jgi:hypothetical protein
MAAGRVMKRIRVDRPRIRRERAWTVVLLAAMAAVALRAAARRPEPRWAPGAESTPIMVGTPAPPGRTANAVEQMQDIFHELHADGRNAACTVCDSQYWLA